MRALEKVLINFPKIIYIHTNQLTRPLLRHQCVKECLSIPILCTSNRPLNRKPKPFKTF